MDINTKLFTAYFSAVNFMDTFEREQFWFQGGCSLNRSNRHQWRALIGVQGDTPEVLFLESTDERSKRGTVSTWNVTDCEIVHSRMCI